LRRTDRVTDSFGHAAGLRGRVGECALLDDMVSAVRRGESRCLLLRGEAGIGKTALLEHMIASASDLTVVRAVGVESEMEMPFASLHQLCGPLLGRLSTLPAPQRSALEIVFGLSAGEPPDRFLVGLAVLSLFAAVAERQPLLCVIDDAQWLDEASGLTLAFVTRRLLAEPVGIVFAARQPGEHLRHVPDLEVRGLTNGDARALLNSAVRFKLDDRIRDRIVAETGGNPLALLELPRGMTATQLAGGFGLLTPKSLAGRIEESFVRRLDALSDEARRLLLLAAAEPVGDPLLLWRACERLWIGPTAAEAAEADGLLAIGERVTFRHPLVRSAVYQAAAVEDRRAVHTALAEATDRDTDPDRRAWHLASAAAGPNEDVASELVRSAGRAQARGGLAAAAAFLRRAVTLTSDPARRAERAITAAEANLQAGAFDAALALLATAEAGPLDEFQRARIELLRAHIAFAAGAWSEAPPLLLKAAKQLEHHDMDLARETYLTAWGAAGLAEDLLARDVLIDVCAAARGLPPRPGAPRPLDVLLEGFALLITEGHAAATPTLQRAVQAVADIPVDDVLRWGWMAAGASAAIWDDEGLFTSCTRQVQLVREAGALAALPIYLTYLGMATVWLGDLAGAASFVAEIENVSAATGSRFPPYVLLRLRALQGREREASDAIASAMQRFGGQGMGATRAQWAAAVLYNGLGRYEEAAAAGQHATAHALNHWVFMWVLPELVEAAARANHMDLARDALERLTQTTQPCATEFALGVEARCRALVSSGESADALYREAIQRLARTRLRPEIARAHLLYGEWLRRANRRIDARAQLRTAHDMLVAIGMEAFGERARVELESCGEKVRKRTSDSSEGLTAQERQIARLARDGLSNPEIGARLFLSPRTVEWHMRNVFGKLGVRSRRELASALASTDSPLVSA
jgi:DNA-binding CsgD family transcriptional regulator/tetratricopeptide (TPR) repeat protein